MSDVYAKIGYGTAHQIHPSPQQPWILARATGRGSQLRVPPGMTSLWLCLGGRVDVETGDGVFKLGARQALVVTPESASCGVVRGQADVLVLALPASGLSRLMRGALPTGTTPALFPTQHRANLAMLRAAIALIRAHEGPGIPDDGRFSRQQLLVQDLMLATLERQSFTAAWLERAYGRTEGHRRRVLMRLLRARNRILNAPFERHEIEGLALVARYSKSHFIRLFRDVFGTTPHDLLTEARIDLAKHLIAGSRLAISEVANNVGFDSRCAFSRLFKRRVGISAQDYRRIALQGGELPEAA